MTIPILVIALIAVSVVAAGLMFLVIMGPAVVEVPGPERVKEVEKVVYRDRPGPPAMTTTIRLVSGSGRKDLGTATVASHLRRPTVTVDGHVYAAWKQDADGWIYRRVGVEAQ